MSRRPVVIVVLWLVAFAGGLALDRPVAGHARDHGWDQKRTWTKATHRLAEGLKLPGTYYVTAAAAVAVGLRHPLRWRAAAAVAGAGAISGLNSVLKWVVGRRRPVTRVPAFDVEPFVGGLPGLFGAEGNLSFPSGHACLAFALAASLARLLPRWRWRSTPRPPRRPSSGWPRTPTTSATPSPPRGWACCRRTRRTGWSPGSPARVRRPDQPDRPGRALRHFLIPERRNTNLTNRHESSRMKAGRTTETRSHGDQPERTRRSAIYNSWMVGLW